MSLADQRINRIYGDHGQIWLAVPSANPATASYMQVLSVMNIAITETLNFESVRAMGESNTTATVETPVYSESDPLKAPTTADWNGTMEAWVRKDSPQHVALASWRLTGANVTPMVDMRFRPQGSATTSQQETGRIGISSIAKQLGEGEWYKYSINFEGIGTKSANTVT